ncbi:MAG: class I SAM-dependent methyltransferase [Planctomycetes bacterium]|nr:class I SAM-dependent methyltransferase [Planctomycetota bacterium]
MTTDLADVPASASPRHDATAINRAFYDHLWAKVRWPAPERFNTWTLVDGWCREASTRLEVGPGMRPRLPIAGTRFVDLSPACVERLRAGGADAQCGSATALPFADRSTALVCAFDIIEHVEDDQRVLSELVRVLADGGRLVLSFPLFAARWTPFDAMCGHVRRYEPPRVLAMLAEHGLEIVESAGYGMQPRQWLVDFGMFWFKAMPRRAMFLYNHVLMPIGLKMQQELTLTAGTAALTNGNHDEVLLVCRRRALRNEEPHDGQPPRGSTTQT